MMVRRLSHIRPLTLALVLTALAATGWAATAAKAEIAPARVLDGPSSTILDVDGAALAPDGTGGIVYRRIVNGLPHVFAVRYLRGQWSRPLQVDGGEPYAGTFPTIAAADGGRLVVVWATPWATRSDHTAHFQLMSAVIGPGATGFGDAIQIDPRDIGDGTAAYPSVAMAPNGSAYVAYRVVTNALGPGDTSGITPMRTGDELVDVRVARFNGLTWSSLGAVNRLTGGQVTMRKPTAANAPVVAIDSAGTGGVVLWQEPSIDGVARIWGRRLFGATPGNVLSVSPMTLNGAPVTTDADAPAVSTNELDEVRAAFRLSGGAGSPLKLPSIFLNSMPVSTDSGAALFAGPTLLDSAATIGVPSVSLDDDGNFRVGYTANGTVRTASGDDDSTGAPATFATGAQDPALITHDPAGGGVVAWQTVTPNGLPVVGIRQDFPNRRWQTGVLSAPLSGPLDGLSVGQSDRGDALVAFRQGSPEQSQVLASMSNSTPAPFSAAAPQDWVPAAKAKITWGGSASISSSVTYSVVIDGVVEARGLTTRSLLLKARALGDGAHDVQVIATDGSGQQTPSNDSELKLDVNPPQVTIRKLAHRTIQVRVHDGASGLKTASTRIDFGDHTKVVKGKATIKHRYKRSMRVVVIVRSVDKVGNAGRWRERVQIR